MAKLEAKDLKREIRDLASRAGADLRDDDAFLFWFLRAYVTRDEQGALRSLTGYSGEKGLDAVFIDDAAEVVVLVQGKYHKGIMQARDGHATLIEFASLSETLVSDQAYAEFASTLEPAARNFLGQARRKVMNTGYGLLLYFVTTGKVGKSLADEAEQRAERPQLPEGSFPRFELVDGRRVLGILRHYLRGVAPAIPSLVLSTDGAARSSFDEVTSLESWVLMVPGSEFARALAQLDDARLRLYALNVRGFLGETKVNREIQATLRQQPEFFWYFNNGVTIVCDSAFLREARGRQTLEMRHPQIINGQQTTRALFEEGSNASKARVLVRVIVIPSDWRYKRQAHTGLVNAIVRATNWQNAISAGDLRSNDDIQVFLENEFRALRYIYVRKRQTRREVMAWAGRGRTITKEELARAVGGCLFESLPLRLGQEKLFEDPHYGRIFRSKDPRFYLSCFHLMARVNERSVRTVRGARTSTEWQRAKFIVQYQLWKDLSAWIKDRGVVFTDSLRDRSRRVHPVTQALDQCAEALFRVAEAYYRRTAGRGQDRVEPTVFFKRHDVYEGFQRFWRSRDNGDHRARYRRRRDTFHKALVS